MVARARTGRSGELGNRSVSRLGGWVRWIGWIGVWDAGRDGCGEEHLEHAQGYGLTWPRPCVNAEGGRREYSYQLACGKLSQ